MQVKDWHVVGDMVWMYVETPSNSAMLCGECVDGRSMCVCGGGGGVATPCR
jgi:hypothetical protein